MKLIKRTLITLLMMPTVFSAYCYGALPEGEVNGVFSVNENVLVRFSRGNLQYQASTDTWRFATNQYDYIGDANNNISGDYSGWIDLFGWGTGIAPTNSSTNSADYNEFVDWGDNIHSDGNDKASKWRTLTIEEWSYLFNKRITVSGIRFAKARVNHVNGVVVLPDNWTSDVYELHNSNQHGASFISNVIGASNWDDMQNAGAVFLPAAGLRLGNQVQLVGYYGNYWSASCIDNYIANYMYFHEVCIDPTYGGSRFFGHSVRLVCNIE